jgi:hypothetical protein
MLNRLSSVVKQKEGGEWEKMFVGGVSMFGTPDFVGCLHQNSGRCQFYLTLFIGGTTDEVQSIVFNDVCINVGSRLGVGGA